jgi:hypothetical protein
MNYNIVQTKKMRHENKRNISTLRFYGVFDSKEKATTFADTFKHCAVSVHSVEPPQR